MSSFCRLLPAPASSATAADVALCTAVQAEVPGFGPVPAAHRTRCRGENRLFLVTLARCRPCLVCACGEQALTQLLALPTRIELISVDLSRQPKDLHEASKSQTFPVAVSRSSHLISCDLQPIVRALVSCAVSGRLATLRVVFSKWTSSAAGSSQVNCARLLPPAACAHAAARCEASDPHCGCLGLVFFRAPPARLLQRHPVGRTRRTRTTTARRCWLCCATACSAAGSSRIWSCAGRSTSRRPRR